MRRRPLLAALLLVGLSLGAGAQPALADHSSPVLTYTPKEGPEGTVISFTISGCKEAAQGPQGRPETDITISLFPSSFGGGDQRHFDISADDEQVTGTFTVRTRAEYAASSSGFDGRTLFLGVVCWEGGDTEFDDEFVITDTAPTTTTTPATTATTTSTTLPAAGQPAAGLPAAASPDTQSEAQRSAVEARGRRRVLGTRADREGAADLLVVGGDVEVPLIAATEAAREEADRDVGLRPTLRALGRFLAPGDREADHRPFRALFGGVGEHGAGMVGERRRDRREQRESQQQQGIEQWSSSHEIPPALAPTAGCGAGR